MRNKLIFGIASTILLLLPSMSLAENYSVSRSISVQGDADEIWHFIGDFCDIDDWHPQIVSCNLKARDNILHRHLELRNGLKVIEKRVAEEPGLSYTYSIVSVELPIRRYTSTLSITRGDPNQISWSGRFKSDDPAMERIIGSLYDKGLSAIEGHFSQ